MATDIHIHLEHKSRKTNKYVYDFETDVDRIYALFGALAGVRGPFCLYKQRGLPKDISPEVLAEYQSWGDDAHTPSWLTINEFRKCLDLTIMRLSEEYDVKVVKSWLKSYEGIYEYMKYSEEEGEQSRIVFWFDN